jgi:hypothetical protein
VAREIVEASVFWGGDLFAVKYFALGERVWFDDVPKAESVEVRTRVVEAAPKTPRNRWDLPLVALALTAACMNAMVVGSLAHQDGPTFGGTLDVVHSSDDRLAVVADREPVLDYAAGIGVVGAKEEPTGVEGRGDDDVGEKPIMDALGDTGMIAMLAQYRDQRVGSIATPWAPEPHFVDADEGGLHYESVYVPWGVGGLGLSGTGEGGGGKGNGIVLDRVHTEPATGSGHGHLTGHHVGFVCHLPIVTAISCYRIPPEIIQRVVRGSLGRFRACYADGLKKDPALAGRVVTKFVIARDGTVSAVSDGGSDLADKDVRECVERAFMSLEFPANPDNVATVTYPIVMSPEE